MPLKRAEVISPEGYLPDVWRQLLRLHRILVWARWILVGTCTAVLGIPSLWALRGEIAMLGDYFTWPGLRYALIFNPWPTLGLALCLGLVLSTLIWQSRNILFGLPLREVKRLERQLQQINQQGTSHPLWSLVHRSAPP